MKNIFSTASVEIETTVVVLMQILTHIHPTFQTSSIPVGVSQIGQLYVVKSPDVSLLESQGSLRPQNLSFIALPAPEVWVMEKVLREE